MGRLRRWAIWWLSSAAAFARALAEWLTPASPANDRTMAALRARYPDAPDHWLRMIAERAPHLAEPDPLEEALRGTAPPPFASAGHRQPASPGVSFADRGQQPAREWAATNHRSWSRQRPSLPDRVRRLVEGRCLRTIGFRQQRGSSSDAAPAFTGDGDERADRPAFTAKPAHPVIERAPPGHDMTERADRDRPDAVLAPAPAPAHHTAHPPFPFSERRPRASAPLDMPAQTRNEIAHPVWPPLPTPSTSPTSWTSAARPPAPADAPRGPEPHATPRQTAPHSSPPRHWPALPPALDGFEDAAEPRSRFADLITEQEAGRWSA